MKLIQKIITYYNSIIDEYDIYYYNKYGQETLSNNYFKQSVYDGKMDETVYGQLYEKVLYFYNKNGLLIKSVEDHQDAGKYIKLYKYKKNTLIQTLKDDEKTIFFYNSSNRIIKKEVYCLSKDSLINYIIYKKEKYIVTEEHYDSNNILVKRYEEYFEDNLLVKSIDYEGDRVLEIKSFEYNDKLLLKETTKKYLNNKDIYEEIYYYYNIKNLLEKEKKYINRKLDKTIEYIYNNNYLKEIIDNNNLWGKPYTLRIVFERIELDETILLNKIKELKDEGFDFDYIEEVLNINLEELRLNLTDEYHD